MLVSYEKCEHRDTANGRGNMRVRPEEVTLEATLNGNTRASLLVFSNLVSEMTLKVAIGQIRV